MCHEEAKVLHRDIKPENCMLNKRDELVLVDFGISKCFEGDNDIVKGSAGTMLYFAPEIVRTGVKNKVIYGRHCDIWAAGVTLYNIASGGKKPFDASDVFELKDKLLNDEVDYSGFKDLKLVYFLQGMLNKDP
jgi:serine/threonine protein kinase